MKGIGLLQECNNLAREVMPEVFQTASADHRVEPDDMREISTSDLKYVAIPYHLGQAFDSLYDESRDKVVPRAIAYYEHYVQLCCCLGLVDTGVKKGLISGYTQALLAGKIPENVGAKRNLIVGHHKIEQYATKALMEVNKRRMERMSYLRRSADAELTIDDMNEDDDLSEHEREFIGIKLMSYVSDAAAQLNALHDESELLEYGRQVNPDTGLTHAEEAKQEWEARQAEPPKPETGRLPVYTEFNSAEEVQKFALARSRHEVPLDTAAMMEQAMRDHPMPDKDAPLVKNPRSRDAEELEHPRTKEEQEEWDIEHDDPTARQKTRDWDEFKDENPTGWGNRANKG